MFSQISTAFQMPRQQTRCQRGMLTLQVVYVLTLSCNTYYVYNCTRRNNSIMKRPAVEL